MKLIFNDDDLLKFQDIENYIKTDSNVVRAEIIEAKINKYILLIGSKLYILKENRKYEVCLTDYNKYINNWICKFLNASFSKLSDEQQRIIKSDYKKKYDIINNTKITYIENLICDLEQNDIIDNNITGEIHFNNGYIDLNTLEFKERTENHYVSSYIKNDYIPSTKQQQKKIMEILKKIYSNEEDLKVILNVIGASITGKSHLESEILFLLGTGSSGKSFIMNLCKSAFDVYVKSLVSNAFSAKNDKSSKTLAGYLDKMPTRISWVNELKNEKIDDSVFKQIVDGEATTTRAYYDGNYDVSVKHKIFITANEIANIKLDTGIIRRIRGYTHTSTFIKRKDDNGNDLFENPKKNIYYADSELLNKIIKEGLINAFIDIVIFYSKKYLHGDKIVYTEAFNETKKILTKANDTLQDFIDSKLIITDNKIDRIGKNRMMELYANFSKKNIKELNLGVLLSGLKDKGISYEATFTCDNIKGVYVGVLERTADYIDTDENENENENTNESINYKQKYEELLKEMEEMKRRYNLMVGIDQKKNEKELNMDQPNNIKNLLNLEIDTENTNPFDDLEGEPIKKKEVKKIKIKKPKDDDDVKVVTKEVKPKKKTVKVKKEEELEGDLFNDEDFD